MNKQQDEISDLHTVYEDSDDEDIKTKDDYERCVMESVEEAVAK